MEASTGQPAIGRNHSQRTSSTQAFIATLASNQNEKESAKNKLNANDKMRLAHWKSALPRKSPVLQHKPSL